MMQQDVEYESLGQCQTWQHPDRTAGKVIIVFDDFYDALEAPSVYAVGLKTLAASLPRRDDVVAVGFFDLPSCEASKIAAIVNVAAAWAAKWREQDIEFFILVDMFRGDAAEATGPSLIEELKRDDGRVFSKRVSIGILSVLGAPTEDLPAHPDLALYPVFVKSSLRRDLSKELLEFLHGDDVVSRLWPVDVSSDSRRDFSSWFAVGHPYVPHNWAEVDFPTARDAIAEYLELALGFSVPSHWLEEAELKYLHADLKFFFGSSSTCHMGRANNLTLGGLLLLFGAAVGRQASELLSTITWTEELARNVVLPPQTRDDARAVANALAGKAGLFRALAHHDEDRRFLVENLWLSSTALTIEIDLDPTRSPKKGRPSLLSKVLRLGEPDGGTYSAYKRFVIASAESKNGREARCVLNVKVHPKNDGNHMLLEFLRCAS